MKLIIQSKVRTAQKEDSIFVLEQVNRILKNHTGNYFTFAGNRIIDSIDTVENSETFVQATMVADLRDFPGEGMEAITIYDDRLSQEIGAILRQICKVRGAVSIKVQEE